MSEYLDFAKELAREAGQIMKTYFLADEIGLETKQDQTPVTMADKKINSLVISSVKQKFPDHGVLGEEESYNLNKPNLWIVDPLDGTPNFANGIAEFAFSIAYVENGAPIVAVVFDPIAKRLLYAEKGTGAYENGTKLLPPNKSPSDNLKIASWVVGGIDNSVFKDVDINDKVAGLYAQQGNIDVVDPPVAYALATVGAGSLDGAVSTIKTAWDVVAGSLIAEEAGAKVTDLFGSAVTKWDADANGILVAPPLIHEYLLKTIKPALDGAR